MKNKIILIFALVFLVGSLCLVCAAPQKVFLIKLNYDNGTVSLSRFLVTEGYYNAAKENSGDYEIKGYSCTGEILFSQKFNFNLEVYMAPPPEWFDENGNQIYIPNASESVILLNQSEKEFIFPYFNNTKEIDVYGNNSEILKIDKGFENNCTTDKEESGNPVLDKTQDDKKGETTEIIPFIITLLAAILVFYLIYRYYKRKHQ